MISRSELPPDLARPDMGAARFAFWRVDPDRQSDAVDAIDAHLVGREWPMPGLLSYNLFGRKGTLLHYAQLTDVTVRPEPPWAGDIGVIMPGGVGRIEVIMTTRYRSSGRRQNAPLPGIFNVGVITLETPGEDQQRAWVDGMFEAAGRTEPPPESGLLAVHFHLSTDTTRVISVSEWTSIEAYQDAYEEGNLTLRSLAHQQLKISSIEVDRYRFAFGLVAVEPPPGVRPEAHD